MFREALAITAVVVTVVTAAVGWQWYEQVRGLSPGGGNDSPAVSVARIAWSADGRRLMALFRGDINEACQIVIYEFGNFTSPQTVDVGAGRINAATVSPDGDSILAAAGDGRVWRIEIASPTRTLLATLPAETICSAIAAAPGGGHFALGLSDGSIILDGVSITTTEGDTHAHRGAVSSLEYSQDGLQIVSASMDGSLKVWSADGGQLLSALVGHTGPATAAAFLPDGRSVLSCGRDDSIRLWDVESSREIWQASGPGAPGALSVAVSSDGAFAACGGFGDLCVWNLRTRKRLAPLTSQDAPVTMVRFSPDGRRLAASSLDGSIAFWDVSTWLTVDWIDGMPGDDASPTGRGRRRHAK